MCKVWIRRVESYGGQIYDSQPVHISYCSESRNNEPCSNQRRKIIRGSNSSFSTSPGLMSHDASSSASSMPGTPTSGPRFDPRDPFKAPDSSQPFRYGSHLNIPPMGIRSARNPGSRPILSQPNPPDHRRVYSDSEFDSRAVSSGSERATEILDRDAAREAARREQRRRRRFDDMRREEEESDREGKERALDQEELRTQQRMSWREQLREDSRRKQREEDERKEREARIEKERREQRQREADDERLEQLRREIAIEKEHDRLRQEQEEQDDEFKRQLDALLEEERMRKARKAQLERELQHYQELESRLDYGDRRRAEQAAAERQMYEIANARQADDIRRAENSKHRRDRETELDQELKRLHALERKLEDVRRMKQQPSQIPPHPPRMRQHPVTLPIRPGYGPLPPSRPYLTQSSQAPVLDDLLRERPETILNTNVRRTHGENVLDRARQRAEEKEGAAEYRVPMFSGLNRRNTIGGGERNRERQYRNISRYPRR